MISSWYYSFMTIRSNKGNTGDVFAVMKLNYDYSNPLFLLIILFMYMCLFLLVITKLSLSGRGLLSRRGLEFNWTHVKSQPSIGTQPARPKPLKPTTTKHMITLIIAHSWIEYYCFRTVRLSKVLWGDVYHRKVTGPSGVYAGTPRRAGYAKSPQKPVRVPIDQLI